MEYGHFFDEPGFGFFHVVQGLPRYRLRVEEDEIHAVPLGEGIPYLGIPFGSADARAVSGARINDDYGSFLGIDDIGLSRNYAGQIVIHRPLKGYAGKDDLVVEGKDRGLTLSNGVQIVVSLYPESVHEHDTALHGIDTILIPVVHSGIGFP